MIDKQNIFRLSTPVAELLNKSYLAMTQYPKINQKNKIHKQNNYQPQDQIVQLSSQCILQKTQPRKVLALKQFSNNFSSQQQSNDQKNIVQKQYQKSFTKQKKSYQIKKHSNNFTHNSVIFDQNQLSQMSLNHNGNVNNQLQLTHKYLKYQIKTEAQLKNSQKISTSRALQLYSKLIKFKTSQSSIIQRRKATTSIRNKNFNVKKMELKDKAIQQKQRQQKRIKNYKEHKANLLLKKSKDMLININSMQTDPNSINQYTRLLVKSKGAATNILHNRKAIKQKQQTNFKINPWETFIDFQNQ